tara:strand:+ start:2245 stop:3177 length:933 start_codon:yes stop_codon:yes gene_type:complete
MRNAFAQEIVALAEQDSRVVLLSGDIGNRLFDCFKVQFPDRFYNCGIAEANMVTMAAGMAKCGLRPYVYTITPFVTYRVMEQIRSDVAYHNVPVVIVGTGSGLSYASLGATHHSLEEVAMLRTLPGMNVTAAGDAFEVKALLRSALKLDSPSYIRIGKKGEALVHAAVPELEIGKAHVLQRGGRVALLAFGNVLALGVEVSKLLEQQSIEHSLYSFHTVKPLDSDTLWALVQSADLLVTLEEHSLIGGFGSAVAEWFVDLQISSAKLLRFGTPDAFFHLSLTQARARELSGLEPLTIHAKILNQLEQVVL